MYSSRETSALGHFDYTIGGVFGIVIFMIYLIPFYLAIVSRIHGGAVPMPKVIKNLLWAVAFGYVTFEAYQAEYSNTLIPAIVAAIVTAISLMKATGHGQYMSLGTVWKPIKPEKLDWVVRLWFGVDPRTRNPLLEPEDIYDRCLLGLAVTGVAAVIGGVIALGYLNPIAGLILAIGGALKAVSYTIGWYLYPSGKGKGLPQLNEATQVGEFLTGLFAGLGLAIVAVIV